MDKTGKVISAIVSTVAMFEDDSLTTDLVTKLTSTSNDSISILFNKDRQRHFRLGHLFTDETWIERYLDTDLHDRFRMRKDTFGLLVEVIRPLYPQKLNRGDSPRIEVEKSVAMAVYYLGHQLAMDDVGDRFGVAPSSVHKEVDLIVDILCSLKSKFIVWPSQNDCAVIQEQFLARAGIPNVIGAIGCFISVIAPAADQDAYINRKMRHAIILQGICTATKIFTNVSIGTPGSRNDSRALAFSSFYRKLEAEGPRSIFYDDIYHLVGDKAYPNRSWLLAPFKNYGNLTRRHRNYNYKHSVTRVVIEHTFGLLQGRWRRLLQLPLKHIEKDSNYVLACCVLHNFCYLHNDTVIEEMVEAVRLREAQQFEGGYDDNISKALGAQKRDRIVDIL